jgi:hypothetical protein
MLQKELQSCRTMLPAHLNCNKKKEVLEKFLQKIRRTNHLRISSEVQLYRN